MLPRGSVLVVWPNLRVAMSWQLGPQGILRPFSLAADSRRKVAPMASTSRYRRLISLNGFYEL